MSVEGFGSGLAAERGPAPSGRNAERFEQDERYLNGRRGRDYEDDFGGDRFEGGDAPEGQARPPRQAGAETRTLVEERRPEPRPEPRVEPKRPEKLRTEARAPRGPRTDVADLMRLAADVEIPQPLRIAAGEVVVVIGEADAVIAAGLLVADEVGSEAPVVIGRADVQATITVDELPPLQHQARRWSAPLTVALPARPTTVDAERVARLAVDIDPAAVVVCVDATRRAHATNALLHALEEAGIPARRLSVHRAAESPDPLDTLSLDVPVGFLDGRPATTGAWAGLLLDATGEHGRR